MLGQVCIAGAEALALGLEMDCAASTRAAPGAAATPPAVSEATPNPSPANPAADIVINRIRWR